MQRIPERKSIRSDLKLLTGLPDEPVVHRECFPGYAAIFLLISKLGVMIADPSVLASLCQQWTVVTRFCSGSHRQYQIPGGPFINETPPESFFNLPLLLAYAVLDQVLDELIAQGSVPKPRGRSLLGAKMVASRGVIAWQDYVCVELGKDERNKIAHEGKLLDRKTCIKFIQAIEVELKAWHILS